MVYDFLQEPSGQAYRKLVEFCSRYANEGLLIVRDSNSLSASGKETKALLRSLGATSRRISEWPGTRLLGEGSAECLFFPLSQDNLRIISTRVDRLYQWQHPDQPEDICLFRKSGEDILATIAHEGDGYLTLSSEEYADFCRDKFLSSNLSISAHEI